MQTMNAQTEKVLQTTIFEMNWLSIKIKERNGVLALEHNQNLQLQAKLTGDPSNKFLKPFGS